MFITQVRRSVTSQSKSCACSESRHLVPHLWLSSHAKYPTVEDVDIYWRFSPLNDHVTRTNLYSFNKLYSVDMSIPHDCAMSGYVGVKVEDKVVDEWVTRRLDYCNALLAGLPKSTIALLQSVQNAVASLSRTSPAWASNVRQREPQATAEVIIHWRLLCLL